MSQYPVYLRNMEKLQTPRLLMVCLGNICRSPMAEGYMREILLSHGVDWLVDSAGTGHWHVGEAPDNRAIRTLAARGISIAELRARQFKTEDFDRFTHIFVMDSSNYQDVIKKARNEFDRSKVQFLTESAYPREKLIVPDPWYGDTSDFEKVADLIQTSCEAIYETLKKR